MTATRSAATSAPAASPSPLSVDQEALWYRALLAPTALTYNEAISFRKDGPLDVAALRQAFNELVRRHEAWRTTFDTVDGEPVQVVRPAPVFELPLLDLSELSAEHAERRAVELVAETARVPYDVRHGPLLRPWLIRFASDHHRLYLAMHHLIFDGVSLTGVLPELATLYGTFSAGRSGSLADAPLTYVDYARWEQAWIEKPRAQRRLAHWERRLDDAPALSLALDHPRPSTPQSRGGAVPLSMSAASVDSLRRIGVLAGGTLFQVLAATWSLLLSRHTAQEDVVFAVAADQGAGRHAAGTLATDPVASLWMGLISGARIVLASAEVAAQGSRLRRLIADAEVTLVQASPGEWQCLIDTGLRSVRGLRALSGGAPLSSQLAVAILERCRVLWNAYGMAETSGYCTLGEVRSDGPVTIGGPLANTRAYVLDRHDRPVPVGVPGELVIAGEGVVAGYLDDGDDAGFIPDPFASGRALRTGARARWRPDGRLELGT